VLAFLCARECWRWSVIAAAAVSGAFLIVDLAFFSANLVKIAHGGWVPILVAGLLTLVMTTWRRGRTLLSERIRHDRLSVAAFLDGLAAGPPLRAPGTAVFMDSIKGGIPRTLLHNLKHNKVLHEHVILLTVVVEEIPRVPAAERVEVSEIGPGFHRLVVHCGFMEQPDVPAALRRARDAGLRYVPMETTFFIGRETLLRSGKGNMAPWRKRLFAFMSRNAQRATVHYHLPPNRVIEIGAEVQL